MSGSVAGKRLGPEYSESAPCLLICWEKKNSAPTNLKMEPTQECWMTSEPLDHAMPGGHPPHSLHEPVHSSSCFLANLFESGRLLLKNQDFNEYIDAMKLVLYEKRQATVLA